jgi:DNA-binding transcriptional LysR family regulator
MNLKHLHHVVALAEYQSFHRAALAIGVTQSALSQSIRNLEDELGISLFDRGKRVVIPTVFGLSVVETAKSILVGLSNMRREIDLMRNLQSGRLMISCAPWVAESLLAPSLSNILTEYPKLRFSVRVGGFENIMSDMLAGAIDMYIGIAPEIRDERFDWQDIYLPPQQLLCNPNHPLLSMDNLTPSDCLEYPLAAAIMPNWYFEWLWNQVGDPIVPDGRDIHSYFLESDDIGLIRQLIKNTDAIGSMFPTMVAGDIERGELHIIPLKEMNFSIPAVICRVNTRPISPAGELLMRQLFIQADFLALHNK